MESLSFFSYELSKITKHCSKHRVVKMNLTRRGIGHFRVTVSLFFKASLVAHPFIWKLVFICMWMKTDFHMKGLALKKRPKVIWKWPIRESRSQQCLDLLLCIHTVFHVCWQIVPDETIQVAYKHCSVPKCLITWKVSKWGLTHQQGTNSFQ